MTRKAFTVAEANALIPVMERVLRDIQLRIRQVERTAEQLQILDVLWGSRLLDESNPDHAEAQRLRLEIASFMSEIEGIVENEIHGRGLRFPQGGLDHGLIDFPTTWRGRWVFLCWRRGEPRIEAWHEVDAGFAGRQALTVDHVHEMGREQGPSGLRDIPADS